MNVPKGPFRHSGVDVAPQPMHGCNSAAEPSVRCKNIQGAGIRHLGELTGRFEDPEPSSSSLTGSDRVGGVGDRGGGSLSAGLNCRTPSTANS